MGLFDHFFHRARAGATPGTAGADMMSGEQAEQARVRARRRLIGAVVLLGIGLVAFPLLFETQPRPIPVDVPIVIPPRESAPPLALPAPKAAAQAPSATAAAPGRADESKADEPARSAQAQGAAAEPAPPAPVAKVQPEAGAAKPAAARPAAASPTAAKSAPAKAAADAPQTPKPSPAAQPAATSGGRFVVQIGAFAEASAVRDVRAKASRAGLKTFTQEVSTQSGKRTRVRVGPFASREDAEKAAAQAKAAGLPGAVMAL